MLVLVLVLVLVLENIQRAAPECFSITMTSTVRYGGLSTSTKTSTKTQEQGKPW